MASMNVMPGTLNIRIASKTPGSHKRHAPFSARENSFYILTCAYSLLCGLFSFSPGSFANVGGL